MIMVERALHKETAGMDGNMEEYGRVPIAQAHATWTVMRLRNGNPAMGPEMDSQAGDCWKHWPSRQLNAKSSPRLLMSWGSARLELLA